MTAQYAKGGIPVDRLPQFVRLMLDHGASVERGSEPLHVSARLTPKQTESVDRTVGRNLRPATSVDAEAWIDERGRASACAGRRTSRPPPTFAARSNSPISEAQLR
ncbi:MULTISPECIES: hypothetical protein [unclassified Streptomyces]|uniref:hypothetical protein n=1 Tax=unclassified Streptomyces TaxID=2593676 RepID=UPI002E2BCBC7|nr:hypothetical protein [Streptomyces sp. NBC_01423]WSX89506.1 hypothetical protein OH827_02615 [Streptomyces sp. NBC_00891]WSY03985.1 hypothetical protein OG464_02615 [Streptomyces sp. NBC_00890]WSZ05611.1 hypothetical protein OG704_02615 [Streptomyces sp. NBC_00869]WSZ26893.1 hypothetical protein OG498_30950 [Streptomyces sp. NBC_00870]